MKEEIFELEGFIFKLSYLEEEPEKQLLIELKGKGRHLTGSYFYDIHQPHNPTGEIHIHLYDKEKEILAINKISGTAHDRSHGIRIPNKAFKELQHRFNDWKWPNNQILESLNYTYILDSNSESYLRPVIVFNHKDFELNNINGFHGFFHLFADDPFLTGGDGGWKSRTVAIIENDIGKIFKVPVIAFQFLDSNI